MNNLFQQKQRELVVAVSKVEELSRQLEMLKNGKMDALHDNQGAVAELDRLYRELQVCNSKRQAYCSCIACAETLLLVLTARCCRRLMTGRTERRTRVR